MSYHPAVVTAADIAGKAPHPSVSTDRGDTSVTLVWGTDYTTQLFATNLASNRTVTLSESGTTNGAHFRIVRTGLGVGTLAVGPGLVTLATLTPGWVDVAHDGTGWRLSADGLL